MSVRSFTSEKLREEFDQSFSQGTRHEALSQGELLAIRVGGARYALRLADVAGIHAGRSVTPLPSSVPTFLGLAGLRGALTPIYDLGRLLGSESTSARHWFVILQSARPFGLAFETFDAHLRADESQLLSTGEATAQSQLTRGAFRDGEVAVPLLHLPSLLESIERACLTPNKER